MIFVRCKHFSCRDCIRDFCGRCETIRAVVRREPKRKKASIARSLSSKSLVPRKGLEPPRSYPLVPETSASTNSATWAQVRRARILEEIPLMSRKKLSKVRRADPFLERALARYEFPLPSREYVSQILADEGRPLAFVELTELLDIDASEREMFQRRLGAMEREGQLMRNREGAD